MRKKSVKLFKTNIYAAILQSTNLDVQLYRAADAVEGNVVGENEFVSKTVNCLPVRYLSAVGGC